MRDEVARYYTAAVRNPRTTERGMSKGALSACAGYTADDLANLPDDTVENSFGCGNPLADCDVRPGDVVLDLGCGAGIDLILAAERVGPNGKVIGVDMTDAMVARARENVATTRHENVQVRKGVIEDLPVDPASVDWVISNCVISLSPEKRRVFSEIFRVLRPRGRMAVSDLVVDDLDGLLASAPWIGRTCVGTAMTERGYLAGIVSAGLSNPSVCSRIEYDDAQIGALLRSEIPEGGDDAGLAVAVRFLAGRVRSARMTAVKPGD